MKEKRHSMNNLTSFQRKFFLFLLLLIILNLILVSSTIIGITFSKKYC